jgi:hypothetical protein
MSDITGSVGEPRSQLKRYGVFSVHRVRGGIAWVRSGVALENRDGTISVHLDSLPLDGELSIRHETKEES